MSDWIFITGGAQRIGKAIAEHFHHNNWNVICLLYTSDAADDA